LERIALRISHVAHLRGRPRRLAVGNQSTSCSHSVVVRSVGYVCVRVIIPLAYPMHFQNTLLSLVRQIVTQPEEELYRILASLQNKEFLYEQPAFPEVEYRFKHALTQEVAYGTVLQEQRKLLHERPGQALETVYVATLPEHYSDLAHHYSRSHN